MNQREAARTISFNHKGMQEARTGFAFLCTTQGLKLTVLPAYLRRSHQGASARELMAHVAFGIYHGLFSLPLTQHSPGCIQLPFLPSLEKKNVLLMTQSSYSPLYGFLGRSLLSSQKRCPFPERLMSEKSSFWSQENKSHGKGRQAGTLLFSGLVEWK